MRVRTITVKNIYGLPYITEDVKQALKALGYTILIGVERLFSKNFEPPTTFTVVVDQFGKLTSCGIPLLGYVKAPTGVYHKVPIDLRKLVSNTVKITSPIYVGSADATSLKNSCAPSLGLLLEYHSAKTRKDLKKLEKRYSEEIEKPPSRKFKWLRRAVRETLKSTDPKEKHNEPRTE